MMLVSDLSTQWLDIPDAVCSQSWQQSRSLSIPGNRWQAYLNRLCLQTVLPWLQERFGVEPTLDSRNSFSVWEMVNGCAIVVGTTRLIFIPTEAMDRSEFRVPQEWIDLPSWVGDYYLAVEVDPDDRNLNIWGYATHQMLKLESCYDASDRTYCLAGDNLIQDLTAFWVMQQLPGETTRTEIPELPALTSTQAEQLLQQLGNTIALPRLEIPFVQWGALLDRDSWLQQLCQHRQSSANRLELTRQAIESANLSQWWQNIFEAGWQAIEDLFESPSDLAFNFRRDDSTPAQVQRVKSISLGSQFPTVILAIVLEMETDGRMRIWVQLLPQAGEVYLPADVSLELLSTTGEVLQSVRSGSTSNYIQLRRFKSTQGRQFRLQIAIADALICEDFIV
jgi:Protein of unknown function (DUF1822)